MDSHEDITPPAPVTLEEAGALAPLIDAGEAHRRAAAGAVVFDVRGAEAYARDGVLEGAIPVDRHTLDVEFALDSPTRATTITADTPVIVACGTVRGSGPVAARLRELGYTDVVHVEGGVPALRDAATPDTSH